MTKYIFIALFFFTSLFASDYRQDDAKTLGIHERLKGSHIKVYIPNMPYLYLSKLINGTLVRSADTKDGWEYMLATNLQRVGKTTYIFTLRKGVKFQDGTPFNANSVIENFKSFLSFRSSNRGIFYRLKEIKKLSNYKVSFTLTEPYELFLDGLTRINIYSSAYLKKFSWGFKNAYTANSTKEAGPYGLGPYILTKGVATGRYQTPIVELVANPYYYEPKMPYIEKITLYTELSNDEILDKILNHEGALDISIIPFNKKIETILSPYAKLFIKPSFQNTSIYFNLLKPNSKLKNQALRVALNQAINQQNLLKFTYNLEGKINPVTASQNYDIICQTTQNMLTHHKAFFSTHPNANHELKKVLNGLTLNVYTMENLMFLWKGIEYQLSKYGVKLIYTITKSEKELFDNILNNRKEPKNWDLLSWANDSWSSNNPWSVFFHYRSDDPWSAIDQDDTLLGFLKTYLTTKLHTKEYEQIVKKIVSRVHKQAYMLSVPSPNKVIAVNKEVYYEPSSTLIMPLWKATLTPYHWSIRKGAYPTLRQKQTLPTRF